jgi:hypothetical protein
LARRGFDPDEVTAYLAELADQFEALAASARQNRYRKLGQEVEAVLRTAHEQAARMRTEAKRAAKAIKDDASLYALEQKREADQDRDEAKRLLVRSQERAASLVREAEEQAANVVRTAEALARTRTTQVLAQAQHRLDRLTHDEEQTQNRLHAARVDLQAMLERAGHAGGVIDLTGDEGPAGVEAATDERPPPPGGNPFALGGDTDPVAEMVREAVSTAVEHAGADRPDPGPHA